MSREQRDNSIRTRPADPARVLSVRPDGRQGPAPMFVFRPNRKMLLVWAAISVATGGVLLLILDMKEPLRMWEILTVPAYVLVVGVFVAALVYLGFFAWTYRPDREILLDAWGIVLPRHGRIAWDQIAEVRFCNYPSARRGMTYMTLTDMRRIYVRWCDTSCPPREFYETLRLAYERSRRTGSAEEGGIAHPPVGGYHLWPADSASDDPGP